MIWQDINNKVKVIIGAGSVLGAFGIVWMIIALNGVSYDYFNWEHCINGTTCYARISINSSLNQVCFNIDESVKVPQMYKKSTTIWINTSKYGFVRTDPPILTKLMVTATAKTGSEKAPDGQWIRDVKTGDCLTKNKVIKLYVRGDKKIYDQVTWKVDIFKIDPVWDAEDLGKIRKRVYSQECKEQVVGKTWNSSWVQDGVKQITNSTGIWAVPNYREVITEVSKKEGVPTGVAIVDGISYSEPDYTCKYNSMLDIVQCDSKIDGNGDGICQPQGGEKCITIEIDTKKEFETQQTAYKRTT